MLAKLYGRADEESELFASLAGKARDVRDSSKSV
jgi:hypothetical protein